MKINIITVVIAERPNYVALYRIPIYTLINELLLKDVNAGEFSTKTETSETFSWT